MAIKLYDDTNFIMIASAIRAKNGLETQYKPSEMATAINALKMAKDVEPNNTSSGLNVNFKDGADGEKYNSLILNIPPLQDGTGDPSPTNKRAFKDYARFILYYSGADKTDYETYTLNHSTLGGSIDLISGAESYFNVSMRLANYSNSITTYTENGVTIFYLPNASSFGDIYSESLKTVEKMSSLSEAAQNMPNNSIAGSKGAAQSSIGFFIRADSFSTVSELIASIGMDDNYPTTWMETNTITSGLFTGRTELGVNNLWAIGYQVYDEQLSQDIPLEVSYKADPILYTQGVVMDMLPQDQVTGAVANFPDGSANPIVEGIFGIVPYQEGTGDPAPSNVRPISGFTGMNVIRCGKNLFNKDSSNIQNNKYINSSGSIRDLSGWMVSAPIPLRQGISYYSNSLMAGGSQSGCNIYNRNGVLKRTLTIDPNTALSFTAQTDEAYILLSVRKGDDEYLTAQFEEGSTATSYEAYQGVTKSVTWTDSAGTVYGGSLNLTTGVLTVDRVYFSFDGSTSVNAISLHSTSGLYFVTVTTNLNGINSTSSEPNIISDKFLGATGVVISHCYITNSGHTLVCVLPDQTVTTKEGANQWFIDNPSNFVYKLATPITYQLTPQELNTLLGTNNIYCDTGDSDIKYRADIDLYIQKKIAEG